MRHAAGGSTRTRSERRPPGRRRAGSRSLPGAGGSPRAAGSLPAGASGPLAGAGGSSLPAAADRPPVVGQDRSASAAAIPPSHGQIKHRRAAGLDQLPYALVLVGTVLAVVTIRSSAHLLRSGTLVLAGVLLLAAGARLCLPDRRAGMLASRRRLLDAAIFAALGVGLLIAGLVIPAAG